MKIKLTQEETVDFCSDFSNRKPASRKDLVDEYKQSPLGFTVTIEPSKTEKTTSQRNYFHKWCRIAAKELGYHDWRTLKRELKELVFEVEYRRTKLNTIEAVIKSSENAARDEYSEMIEKLIFVAAEYGNFVVPDPRTQEKAA